MSGSGHMAGQQTGRRFMRHPSGMPIQFEIDGDVPPLRERLRNVSEGGLCFCSSVPLQEDCAIHLAIPLRDRVFKTNAVVTWCKRVDCGYEVGVRFVDARALFGVRMVEQLCHIEQYREEVSRREGRDVSSEEAASEWIDRFAASFP